MAKGGKIANIPERIEPLFTKRRVFNENGKVKVKEFKPLLQIKKPHISDVNKREESIIQEVLYLHDIVMQRYGNIFTIDMIKSIPEEKIINFRATFKNKDNKYVKGTIIFDSDTFDILFDNFERLLKRKEEKLMEKLVEG